MSQSYENAAVVRGHSIRQARNLFLIAAFLSFALSVTLWFTGSKDQGLFVGLWVPSILALGALVISAERPR